MKEATDKTFETIINQLNKKILLDFGSSWCPPCARLKPILEKVSNEVSEDEAEIYYLDIDDNPTTTSKYGVRNIPTMIIFEDGKEIARQVGLVDKKGILKLLGK
jgi:thioredoxin 1